MPSLADPASYGTTRRRARDAVEAGAVRRWRDVVGVDATVLLHAWTLPGFAREREASVIEHVRADAIAAGLDAMVGVRVEMEFAREVEVGERLTDEATVEAISPRKTTALGDGHFVTTRHRFVTGYGEAVGEQRLTLLVFGGGEGARAGAIEQPPDGGVDTPITTTLVVAGALASNDHEPIHHDRDAARAAGLPDIIVNLMTTCGLAQRAAGSAGRLAALDLSLRAPAHPGDVLRWTREDDGTLVARHARGEHARARMRFS